MLLILLFNFFSFKSKYPFEQSFIINEKMIKFQKQSEFYDVHNIHPLISGTCGPNLNYFLESNHLIITGTGEMINYSPDNYPPWYNDQTSIYNASIEDGVVSIGEYAFYYCKGLISITISDSVISIGYGAFGYCSNLASIKIGNGINSIGDYAFRNCSSLASITIPDSVTSIGSQTFRNCSSLKSIEIGTGVISIREYTFYNCIGLTSITIPDNVASINENAFRSCSGLISIIIGNGVTSIGNHAFRSCSSLTSIIIPNCVTSIGDNAFFNCTELSVVHYLGEKQPSCGSTIFGNTKVEKVNVPLNYKDNSFGPYEIFRTTNSTNFFTIGNLPPAYAIIRIGLFLFPLILP